MDLRVPSGWFFLLMGAVLVAVGVTDPGLRAPLTDVNLNLYCGTFMFAFGGLLLMLAWGRRPG